MGRIESDFIKRLQPSLCPPGVTQANAPWCNLNPAPVDLDSYRDIYRIKSYFPFRPPTAVRFCRAYKEVYSAGVCHGVDSRVVAELSAIIHARKSDSGAWPGIPDEGQIYLMLSTEGYGSSPELIAQLKPQIQAKAKLLRDGIIEARQLDDKEKKEEAERKRAELDALLKRICISDDSPATFRKVSADCDDVLKRHQKIVDAWIKGWAGIGAWVAGTLAVLWALAKTGALEKMYRSASHVWKSSRPPDEVRGIKRLVKNTGRILKTVWAALRIKERVPSFPAAPQANTAPAPPPAPAAPPAPAPAPTSGMDSLAVGKDKSDADVAEALVRVENTARLVADAWGRRKGDSDGWIANLRTAISVADQGVRFKFGVLAFALRDWRALWFIRGLAEAFERRFFMKTVPDTLHVFAHAAGLAAEGRRDEALQTLAGNNVCLASSGILRNELDAIRAATTIALEDIRRLAVTPADDFVEESQKILLSMDGLTRDTGAILDALLKIHGAANIKRMGEMLAESGLSITTVGGLLTAASWINSHEALRRGRIKLRTADETGASISVPSELQKNILRLLYMAGNNSVRHSNPESKEGRSVIFKAKLDGEERLILSVWDNGIGMTEKEKKEVMSSRGRGFGISEMISICRENGWQFDLSSQKDKGTIVKITIDASGWQKGGDPREGHDATQTPTLDVSSVHGALPVAPPLVGMTMPAATAFALGSGLFAGGMSLMI